ncbi:copia protein [Tanacetum coccineum]
MILWQCSRHSNQWRWPATWISKAPILSILPAPHIEVNSVDQVSWRDSNGVFSNLSVSRAWEALRPHRNKVIWYNIVWFPQSIPRHSFHLWLVMRSTLKTQDKLRQWDVGINTDLSMLRCPLCNTQSDSHAHLFFECSFSSQVWKMVCHLADMEMVPPVLQNIIDYLHPMAHKRSARSIFGKLILAASSYFVWLERNARLFKNVKRTPEEIKDVIMVTVRLKLLTFKFKDSASADVKVGGWGGDGGSGEWEFPFPAGSNLSKIQVISNAECIVSVMFTTYSPQGGQHNSKKHGGAGVKGPGILTHNIQLGFGELVSEIRGTYAVYQTVTVITSLTFVVGTQENGPYGKVNGTAFSLPIIDGKITGFWGNSDKYLDSLGVFVANP